MKLSTTIILFFALLLLGFVSADEPECGRQHGGDLCPNNLCCSYGGYCGSEEAYCGEGCQSQCWNLPPPPSPSPPPPSPPPPSPPPPSPPPPSPPPPSPPPPSPPPPSPPPPSPPPPSPPPPSPPPPSPPPPSPPHPPECGHQHGGDLCPNNLCCSYGGYCGSEEAYCGEGCQSQCWNSPPPPSPSPPPPSPPPPSPPPPSPPPPSPPPPSPPPPSPPPPSPPPPSPPHPPECGHQHGGDLCPNNLCCSYGGYCGSEEAYCGEGCQSQCWNSPPPSPSPRSFSTALRRALQQNNAISKIISESLFNEMLKHRKDCPSQKFYTYDAFITAATSFPGFGTTGSMEMRKRELAAFLAQTSQATTGQWSDSIDPHAWGYCRVNTTLGSGTKNDYCTSPNWPCASGKKYNSRGPIQLTHNYNYGLAGEALGLDLVKNPDLVATDPVVSFKTAIWFWMTQHDNKPSCHDILINANSEAVKSVPIYGVIGNIINGGRQDIKSTGTSSIGYYKRYCDMLQVSYGHNLNHWFDQTPFSEITNIQMHFQI